MRPAPPPALAPRLDATGRGDDGRSDQDRGRRGLFRRRGNRRILVLRRGPLVLFAGGLVGSARAVRRALGPIVTGFALAVLLATAGLAATAGYAHLRGSPRFVLREIRVSPTAHVKRAELLATAGVAEGDPLLGLEPAAIARRLGAHPWVARAAVRRQLPGTLIIDVTERAAAGVASLGGLYLVDESGRPFKRATMAEAEGLPIVTGIAREAYARLPHVAHAAYREALAVLALYRARPGRPPVGEVHVEPSVGFSLFLVDGGREIRLGRGNLSEKLARLDRILEALEDQGLGGTDALRVVHLDGPGGRVPVRLGTGGG